MPTITRTITVRLDPELVALLTEIRDRLPEREGVKGEPDPSPDDSHTSDGRCKYPKTCKSEGLHGEPVEPGDLRAGDRVAFRWMGERMTGTLVSQPSGHALCSDTPDRTGYNPYVVVRGEWSSGIYDVLLIERDPLAGELDAAVWHRQFEKEKARAEEAERRVDELEPALARSETERDEWKAKHAALRAAVQVMLAHAEPDSWEDLRLRRILDRDAARTPQANPDTVTLRRDDVEELLQFWIGSEDGCDEDEAITRRVRAALEWGDSDDA